MCIKLRRHFRCAPTVYHAREYLIKCSNPTFNLAHLRSGTIADDNLPHCLLDQNLKVREEWYYNPGARQASQHDHTDVCPNCSGEGDVPVKNPIIVRMNPHLPEDADDEGPEASLRRRAYFEFARTTDPSGHFAIQYCNSLLIWLYTCMFSPASSLYGDKPDAAVVGTEWDEDDEELAELGFADVMVYLLNELVCRSTAFHPSPARLLPRDDSALDEADTDENELGFALPAAGCSCALTKKPFLNNWASHIRRQEANTTYGALMVDKDNFLRDDLRPALRHQEIVFARHKGLQTAVERDERFRAVTSLPMLEIMRPNALELFDRNRALIRDCANILDHCRSETGATGRGRVFNHPFEQLARAELLGWARLIVANDIGISLSLARDILAVFGGLVVRFDPRPSPYSQGSILPAPAPPDFAQCIAETANEYPVSVTEWVRDSTAFYLADGSFGSRFIGEANAYIDHERERCLLIRKNRMEASESELDALRRAGNDSCPICLETFDDHLPSTRWSSRPWQNRRCYEQNRGHWCGVVCLIQFGRAIPDSAPTFPAGAVRNAPPPTCPLCRTEFQDSSPNSVAGVSIGWAENQNANMGGDRGGGDFEDSDDGDPMEL